MSRVLLATYGSAGDVLPLLPIADRLACDGHDVTLAVPRFLGMRLRAIGRPHLTYGSGSQVAALRGARLYTSRFGGWASWRQIAVEHLAPSLADDVASAGALIDEWQPDVVATMTLAAAPRIAAINRGIEHRSLALTPQLDRLAVARRFGAPFLDAVREVAAPSLSDDAAVRLLAWGVGGQSILLHDPALVDASELPDESAVVGYPYWDGLPASDRDTAAIDAWLEDGTEPVVLVVAGSFADRDHGPASLAERLRACGARVLFVDAGTRGRDGCVLYTGYVPLSAVAHRCSAVVHHGGMGTMIGALRAGKPSVVMAGPFDRVTNSELLARAGAGVRAQPAALAPAIDRVLATPSMAVAADELRRALVSPDAAARAASLLLTTDGRSAGR